MLQFCIEAPSKNWPFPAMAVRKMVNHEVIANSIVLYRNIILTITLVDTSGSLCVCCGICRTGDTGVVSILVLIGVDLTGYAVGVHFMSTSRASNCDEEMT